MIDGGALTTARLSLRRPERADVGLIHALHVDPRACAHNPGDLLRSRGDAVRRFRAWDAHWRRYGFGYWSVSRRAAGAPVGFCGVKVVPWDSGEALNLFYRFDPVVWGGGLASEAATAVVGWASAAGRPVVARVRPENVASARVAVRAGLRRAAHLDRFGEDGLDWTFTSG